jgi:hypothetical protein
MSMKNSNGIVVNRARNLPVFSAVPQPTVPPRAPCLKQNCSEIALTAVVIHKYQQVYQNKTNLT